MGRSYVEREQKFDVRPDFAFPPLSGGRPETHTLRAVYYDTDDALLQARGATLRRRTGGTDDGWHLKVPHPDGKLELRESAESEQPPEPLVRLTRGLRFDQPLRERAVLRTVREAHEVCSAEGELVAEVADDRVSASVGPAAAVVRWREVEVELGPAGTRAALERLERELMSGGATPSTVGSKYARAVGDPPQPHHEGVGGLVEAYLRAQLDRLSWGDLRMRRGENVVHKTRVAVRRTRSTLRIFSPVFEEDRAERLDSELAWYAEALGAVRDLDVARRHLRHDLDELPASVAPPETATRLFARVVHRRQDAWKDLRVLLDGDRYGSLLRMLAEWRRDPPWTPAADDDEKHVREFVSRARKKSDKRLARAGSADVDTADEALHRARKAGKRTRYAAELARPVMGTKAKKVARTHERRQDQLGVVQDHRMMSALLRDVAGQQPVDPDLAFACGVLAERHQAAKSQAVDAARSGSTKR